MPYHKHHRHHHRQTYDRIFAHFGHLSLISISISVSVSRRGVITVPDEERFAGSPNSAETRPMRSHALSLDNAGKRTTN
jgi:hypothetical protein